MIIEKAAGSKDILTDQKQIEEYIENSKQEEEEAARLKIEAAEGTYDFVIVDAECSHDGSMKHIEKYRTKWGLKELDSKMPWCKSPEALQKLVTLQRALLRNAFFYLKPGGTLVYSTCSFCKCQNEDIVEDFIRDYCGVPNMAKMDGKAQYVPQKKHMALFKKMEAPCKFTDAEESMARFDPVTSKTSGLFVATLTKVQRND